VARSPGILPSEYASGLRGSLNARPCAYSELARILRATLRAFLRPLAPPQGAPFGRHPAAEAEARLASLQSLHHQLCRTGWAQRYPSIEGSLNTC